jgi:hypothetical protein
VSVAPSGNGENRWSIHGRRLRVHLGPVPGLPTQLQHAVDVALQPLCCWAGLLGWAGVQMVAEHAGRFAAFPTVLAASGAVPAEQPACEHPPSIQPPSELPPLACRDV